MNQNIADETLEDHKYLLLDVQNRAAIAYFAAANRNLSLYDALKSYILANLSDDYNSEDDSEKGEKFDANNAKVLIPKDQ